MALGLLLMMFLFYNGLKSDVTRSVEPMALGLLLSDVSFLQRNEIRCFKIGRAYGSRFAISDVSFLQRIEIRCY